MNADEISKKFNEFISANGDRSPAIAAVRTLIHLIKHNKGTTVNGTIIELREAVKIMEKITGKSKLAVSSACAQAVRFATLNLATIESQDMSVCTSHMKEEGRKYLSRCEKSISRVANRGARFIFDGARVMVHSNSRVVLETLKSVSENIQFSIYIVCNQNLEENYRGQLKERSNIECHTIYDAEVGYRMENIDLVMVGAEAVVKNGGIINKVGTLPLAICAKEMNKPLYVLAESFKFSLLYPLNQEDVPSIYQEGGDGHIRVDYTSPKYITLLVTDRGLLTPTAVCDELIEMYI